MPTLARLASILAVIAFAYLASVATAIIVRAIKIGGRREDTLDRDDARSTSRFTIPVSIVVPVPHGTTTLGPFVRKLLAMNYPEIEVLLVCDAIAMPLMNELMREWQLEARELFYRKMLPTSEVRRIYCSATDPRLALIDQASSRGFADAMNCGVNVARFRYVAAIEPDVTFDADALLRLMAQPLADPGRIVGISQIVEREGGPSRLASIRGLLETRLLQRRGRRCLGGHDVVSVWRRDAVLKCGGFPLSAANPELALMFSMQADGTSSRFVRDSGIFGSAPALSLAGQMRMAGIRQRGAWRLLASMLRRRGEMRWPTWIASAHADLFVPLAHVTLFAVTLAGTVAGWTSWLAVLALVVMLAFGHAAVTVAALLLRGAAPGAPPEPELKALLLSALAEFFIVRPALASGRIVGASRR